ncbi:hypothetical protein FB451DRAFT_1396491 [Mycena latifolia]|nr:hypothetical protein FB451DRAFT_1396491 [Mycena latifolia]
MADQEMEIIEGSEIANAWDLIMEKFPWYKRMDALMGTSPIVNRSAVAHSQTRVNLSILDRDGEAHDGPISVLSDDDTESKISNWEATPPPAGRDDASSDNDDNHTLSSSSPPRADSVPATPAPRVKRIKLTEVKEKQKTLRARAKYNAKTQLEMARLQHQQREAERQREHEMMMMERQMQLETLRRTAPPGPPAAMYGSGAPAYGAPPPDAVFDPRLPLHSYFVILFPCSLELVRYAPSFPAPSLLQTALLFAIRSTILEKPIS